MVDFLKHDIHCNTTQRERNPGIDVIKESISCNTKLIKTLKFWTPIFQFL